MEEFGSQKKTKDSLSPVFDEISILSGSENSEPLSVKITSNKRENSISPNRFLSISKVSVTYSALL